MGAEDGEFRMTIDNEDMVGHLFRASVMTSGLEHG